MFDNDLKKRIKDAILKMGINLPATKVEPTVVAKLEDVKLVDGSILSIDKMEVGANAMFTGADGVTVPAEGEFELEDGTKIFCVAGSVTEIMPKEVEAEMSNDKELIAKLVARVDALEASAVNASTLETELSEVKKALAVSLESIEKIDSTSVAVNLESQTSKRVDKPYSEMNNHEKMLFNKGKL